MTNDTHSSDRVLLSRNDIYALISSAIDEALQDAPHLDQLARYSRSSIANFVSAHRRDKK